ncbi:MAG: hypothetical protein KBT02_09250 [Treponema sp.]|nr:hypothetical protein [Candidatus Treponema caballi]
MNGKAYNRFERQKTQCNTLHELKEVFPKGHVTGKRIKALTQIGAADSWWLRKGIPDKDTVDCWFWGNEPFVIIFDDDTTLEIQFWNYSFSENQIAPDVQDGINHRDLDVNILYNELLGAGITAVKLENSITFETDTGFALVLKCTGYNRTACCLYRGGTPVSKPLTECSKALLGTKQYTIDEGHNPGGFFWIRPANKIPSARGMERLDYAFDAEISILDTYVYDTRLESFMVDYFNPSLSMGYRSPGYETREVEWNLEPNLYSYEDVRNMISGMQDFCVLLKDDFENPSLDTLKEGFEPYHLPFEIEHEKPKLELLRENVDVFIDFYERLCNQLELMMKQCPDYAYIDFMGP